MLACRPSLRRVAAALVAGIVVLPLGVRQATANPHDALDVGFAGSLVGTSGYTTQGDEAMRGTVHRIQGAERHEAGRVELSGGTQGIQFDAAAVDLTGGRQSFVMETTFTPRTVGELSTVMSAGGNLFVRYQGGKLRYGWSSHDSGTWRDYVNTVDAPAAGAEHTISIHYRYNQGRPVMDAMIDGTALPPVTGAGATTTSEGTNKTFVFGNDANPDAGNRGLVGSLQRVRVNPTTGTETPSEAFELQPDGPVVDDPTNCTREPFTGGNTIPVSRTDCADHVIAKASAVRPTVGQADWHDLQLTGFIHYGINTYYNQEWGHGTEDPARFNPTGEVDVDAWVKTLRDNGFTMAILTLKHHDGFQLWPSRYSDYNVLSTPWKNGTGNILRQFTTATGKYGMKTGIYISPADSRAEREGIFGNGSPATDRTIPTLTTGDDRRTKVDRGELPTFTYQATDYGQYFLNQLYEVLTEYGPVDEVWFDGAAGNTAGTEKFDYVAYYDMIAKLQPRAQIAVGGPDVRWIGNEHGEAREDEWNVIPITEDKPKGKIDPVQTSAFGTTYHDDFLIEAARTRGAQSLHWWPGEADMKLTGGWFAHPDDRPKSGDELLTKHWNRTVGRNAVMLLNVPPTVDGSFAPASVAAISDFAKLRRQHFGNDVARGAVATVGDRPAPEATDGNLRTGAKLGSASAAARAAASASPLLIDLGTPQPVNRMTIGEETLGSGQQVTAFRVEAEVDGGWREVGRGTAIGVNRLIEFPEPVTAQRFRITVTSARGPVSISNVSLFATLTTDPGKPGEVYLDCTAPRAGDGTKDRPLNSVEQLRQLDLAPSAQIWMKSGSQCADSTTSVWTYGTADQPVVVDVYDGTTMPTIGDKSAKDWFANKAGEHKVLFPSVTDQPSPSPTADPTPPPTARQDPKAPPTLPPRTGSSGMVD